MSDLLGIFIKRPSVAFAFWGLVILACGLGLLSLQISNNYRAFFDAKNPELQSFDRMEKSFTATDSVNFVVHAPEGTLLTQDAIMTLEWLTQRALLIAYSSRVQSVTNFQYSFANADDIVVEPLAAPLLQDAPPDDAIEQIRQRIASERAVVGRLISKDFKTAQVIATIRLPDEDFTALPKIKAATEQIRAEFNARAPELTIAATGVVLLSQTFFDITLRDMLLLFPLMIALIFGLLYWFFRSRIAATVCLVTVGLGIVCAMGLAGWFGVALTPATGPAPIVIMTITMVDAIHVFTSFFQNRRKGQSVEEAVQDAVSSNLRPILLTSLTTGVGFLTLNFSDAPPFRELGNISAMGTAFACLLSLTLLPAAIVRFCRTEQRMRFAGLDRRFEAVAAITRKGSMVILATGLAALAASGAAIQTLSVEDTFIEWIGPSNAFRKDADYIQERLPSLFTLQYSVRAVDNAQAGRVTDPSYLADLEALSAFIAAQPGVSHVFSFDQIIRRLNSNLNGDDPAYDRIPESQQEAAQFLLLYEMSLPFGEDLTTMLNVDRSASRLVVTLEKQSSAQMGALRNEILSWSARNLEAAEVSAGTGTNMIFAALTESNTRSMFIGSVVAAIAISAILMVALSDVKLGFLSLIPNIAPPLFAFAIWSVFVGTIGLYAAFVVATSLGLIVDATVHMLQKYQRNLKCNNPDALAETLKQVGPAILVSTVVLTLGYGVLTFSSFAIIALMAQMVLLTLVCALLADFIILPALLWWLSGRARERR